MLRLRSRWRTCRLFEIEWMYVPETLGCRCIATVDTCAMCRPTTTTASRCSARRNSPGKTNDTLCCCRDCSKVLSDVFLQLECKRLSAIYARLRHAQYRRISIIISILRANFLGGYCDATATCLTDCKLLPAQVRDESLRHWVATTNGD